MKTCVADLNPWIMSCSPTPSGVRTPPTWGYCRLVGVVLPWKEVSSWGTLPSCICNKWNLRSWCRQVYTPPYWGNSSGAEAPGEKRSGKWGPSSPIHSLHMFTPPSLEPSVKTLAGLLWRPSSASSQTFGVPCISPGPWWYYRGG